MSDKKKCIECLNELDGLKKKFCSNACKQRNHWHKVKEQQNTYHSQTIRSYKRKMHFIEISGGKCINCGYNKNIASLQFHHKNSSEKIFPLDARNLSNKKLEDLIKEFNKCELLCANCHNEHHHPEMEFENVKNIIKKVP